MKATSLVLDRAPPGADLGAIWRRKRSKDAFSSIWGRFLVDFFYGFDQFCRTFNIIFQNFIAVYDIDGVTILAPIQIMWPGGVRASRLNNKNTFLIINSIDDSIYHVLDNASQNHMCLFSSLLV